MKHPEHELVLLVWMDAWADAENFVTLHGVQQTHAPMPVQTLGWVLQSDEIGVSLANERSINQSGEETYRGRTFVLRGMVKSMTPFRLVRPRKAKKKEIAHE